MERKIRSDKKKDVKPTLSMYVKKNLYHFAHITNQPVKDAGLLLIENGLQDIRIISDLQPFMTTNFKMGSHMYFAHRSDPLTIKYRGQTGKVTIKFPNEIFEDMRRLAYSMSFTPTSTAALLIRQTLFNMDFMMDHRDYYHNRIDQKSMMQLERFIKTIRNTIPK